MNTQHLNKKQTYLHFTSKQWAKFKNTIPIKLNKKEIKKLKKINNKLSLQEILEIYLPLSYLLNIYINSNIKNQYILKKLTNNKNHKIPYIIGIVGSVAVGKTTTAKILQTLLKTWSKQLNVELITTDNFLYPNYILKQRNLMKKKGFPQSYDTRNLINFISKIKAGQKIIKAPIYSHIIYDIVQNTKKIIFKPDIIIIEGLNLLQKNTIQKNKHQKKHISDLIDFSIYVDAPKKVIYHWYVKRFLKFYNTSLSNPKSYFCKYANLPKKTIISIASELWKNINELNLQENILPTKTIANIILSKNNKHKIKKIQLKQ